MQLLVEHARRQRDEAARHQGSVAAEATAAARTLSLLHEYRDQKKDRLRDRMREGATSVQALQLHVRFADTLDEAIDKQALRLQSLNRKLDEAREATLNSQRHLKAIETLLQRRVQERAHRVERAERKSMDELAGQRAIRARSPVA